LITTDLIGVSDAAISTWGDHGTDKIQAAHTARSVKRILRQNVDGETVRMTCFRRKDTTIRCAAVDIGLISSSPHWNVRHVVIDELSPLHRHVRHADRRMIFVCGNYTAQHPGIWQWPTIKLNFFSPDTCTFSD
jgi:hypothetical protein